MCTHIQQLQIVGKLQISTRIGVVEINEKSQMYYIAANMTDECEER